MIHRHAWEYKTRKEMTSTDYTKERMRELLIKADDKLTCLGLDLMHKWEKLTGDSCGWDPDAYYTPLEHVLHLIAQEFGMDYNEDIAAEAYRRRQEGEI